MSAADSASPTQFSPYLAGGLPFTDLHPSMSGDRVPKLLEGPVLDHVYDRSGITYKPQRYVSVPPPLSSETEIGMPDLDTPLVTEQKGLRAGHLADLDREGIFTEAPGGTKVGPMVNTKRFEGGEVESRVLDGHHRIVTTRLKAKEQ